MILGDIVSRNAKRYPQKTAVICGSTRLTFDDFGHRVNSAANALIGLGMQLGDRVGIILDNCHQYVELYFAVAKGGGVSVPVNTALAPQEMASILGDADVSILVFGEEFAPLIGSMAKELDSAKAVVAIGDSAADVSNYEQMLAQYPSTEPAVEARERDVVCLLYTSGTTGPPKGAMITHRGMVESALNCLLTCQYKHDDIGLVMTPLFWAVAMMAHIVPIFYVGGTLVITDTHDTEAILELIQTEKITSTGMAPPTAMAILEHPRRSDYDMSTLRCVILAGAPMPVEAHRQAIRALGRIFFKAYGLSETGLISCLVPQDQIIEGPPETVNKLNSCGREVTNVEVKVVDDDGLDVMPGQVGEVIVRGDNLMTGYWKMPQATEEVLKGAYMYTGDLGTMDEDGYLYLAGRKEDLIVSGGQTIHAAEVEEVIGRHPCVAEAAVIGVPDETSGQSIRAIVVRKGTNVTAEDILEFWRQSLPVHAYPRSVVFVERLPRSPTGKVLKRLLEERHH